MVSVGYEETDIRFHNGKTTSTKRVYLKQNEHGYFELTWSDRRDEELISHNFETNYSRFEASIRSSAADGRITHITQLKDGVYELKGTSNEDDANCTSIFDLKARTSNTVCLNPKGEIVLKHEIVRRKVDDLSIYEKKLRDSTITICSNVLHKGSTTCVQSDSKRDWWAFLFE